MELLFAQFWRQIAEKLAILTKLWPILWKVWGIPSKYLGK